MMSEPVLTLVSRGASLDREKRRRWPVPRPSPAFSTVVILPTVLAAIYLLLIATPVYVSEARFVVRAPSQAPPSSLGTVLQGVGVASAMTDAFAVHEYIESRDGLRGLMVRRDVRTILRGDEADLFSRHPRPWHGDSFEDLFKGYKRFVTVGYDSTSGISTLRVSAFKPGDAQILATELLNGSETLVNRLNERAANDAVRDSLQMVKEAEARLAAAQLHLTTFRNRERFIDPTRTAAAGLDLVGGLMSQLATMRAERAQLAEDAPQSPQIAVLDGRIRAFEQQVEAERAKLAGDADSIAPKIGEYERLVLDREFADRALASATSAYETARLEARRQKLYLDRVVEPNLPDKPVLPKRWLALLTVFISALLVYGTGWLIAAGVREHRQNL